MRFSIDPARGSESARPFDEVSDSFLVIASDSFRIDLSSDVGVFSVSVLKFSEAVGVFSGVLSVSSSWVSCVVLFGRSSWGTRVAQSNGLPRRRKSLKGLC